MKVQVLTRSFYEDAYLAFFIRYYLDLGFDRIVIFKADKEELGPFSLDFLHSKEEQNRVVIKYVVNEGNGIYENPENFPYYIDINYDWSLHVDVDEFLVIDRSKYQRIHDYIIDIHKIMDKPLNEIYNVKFRWLCINKLNDDWINDKIVNPELLQPSDMELTTENIQPGTFYDYVLKNKLEIYSFVKGLYQTNKVSLTNTDMDAHVVIFKKELSLDNRIVIDNKFTTINKYKSPLFGSNSTPESNYCNGFILHFNTRSYSNSLTKCLVTQLRDNKKITDLSGFVAFINGLSQADLQAITDKSITDEKRNQLCEQYKKFLNSKRFFPRKIAAFNNKYEYLITKENYFEQIRTIINANSELIVYIPFINLKREREILDGLCCKFGINYNKLQCLLILFDIE